MEEESLCRVRINLIQNKPPEFTYSQKYKLLIYYAYSHGKGFAITHPTQKEGEKIQPISAA